MARWRDEPSIAANTVTRRKRSSTSALEGADDFSNLALACRSCNLHKAAHLTGIDSITRTEPQLFNPRRDVWSQHFQVDMETVAIVGLTELARGTVARLQMNSKAQLAARQHWMRLGIFP